MRLRSSNLMSSVQMPRHAPPGGGDGEWQAQMMGQQGSSDDAPLMRSAARASSESVDTHRYYAEYHGHPAEDLSAIVRSLRAEVRLQRSLSIACCAAPLGG